MESYDLFSLGILNSETVRGTSNFTQFLKASEKKKEKKLRSVIDNRFSTILARFLIVGRKLSLIKISLTPLLHDLFFSSVFWDKALDRLLSSTDS